jgi:hypothetical protein
VALAPAHNFIQRVVDLSLHACRIGREAAPRGSNQNQSGDASKSTASLALLRGWMGGGSLKVHKQRRDFSDKWAPAFNNDIDLR